MYRPKPHILIAINSDGSGSVTQYASYELAKLAYDALSGGTVSAFIYPKPRKSLSTGAIGSPVAIPAKAEFTKTQNATAIYNPGNPAFTAPHPDLVQFTPTNPPAIQTPPLPRVTTSGPFGNNEGYNAWQAFCKLNPTHPECTSPGNPQYGTLISESCLTLDNFTDAIGKTWPTVAATKVKIFADGRGDTYEEGFPPNSKEGGCFYPVGFATEEVNNLVYVDNSVSNPETHFARLAFETYNVGGGWMPVFDLVALDGWTYYGGQDGQGNQKNYVIVGLPPIGGFPHQGLIDYEQGSYLRNVNFNTLSQWSVNGIPVANEPAPTATEGQLEIHYGKWFSDFLYYEAHPAPYTEVGQNPTAYPRQVRLRFRYKPDGPISPFETVPSKTRAGRGIFNEFFSTDLLGIDSTETVQPVVTYEYDYQNVMITEMANEVPVGQRQKAVVTAIVDGPMESGWSDFVYYSAGTLLASDGTYYYKATGDGGYYAELINQPPPCPAENTHISYDSRDEFIYPEIDNAPSLLVGTTSFGIYADGSCGTFESGHTTTYRENGYFLGEGDTLRFYSNGDGGYYTTPRYPSQGESLGYDLTEPVYSNGFQVGTITSPAVADGNGGAMSGGAGTTSYLSYGTLVGSMDGYNYYSNGEGGTYSESAPTYPPAGTFIETVSGNYTYNAGCGDWSLGSYSYEVFADGNGGTYTGNQSGGYTSSGSYLGNCNEYDYYTDGSGGTYSSYTGGGTICPSYGTSTGNSGSDPVTIDVGCGPWTIGYIPWYEAHDGSCGYYTYSGSTSYSSYGEYIGECNGYYYYSDAMGGVYTA